MHYVFDLSVHPSVCACVSGGGILRPVCLYRSYQKLAGAFGKNISFGQLYQRSDGLDHIDPGFFYLGDASPKWGHEMILGGRELDSTIINISLILSKSFYFPGLKYYSSVLSLGLLIYSY